MAMAQPKFVEQTRPRIRNPRTARTATEARIVKSSRARYGGLLRVGAVLGVVLVGLMAYVMLTSNVTSLNYALEKAQHQRGALQEETNRLDDRISVLQSDERLANVASKLGMHEAQTFAVLQLAPPTKTTGSRSSVLDSIVGWFGNDAPRGRAR